MREPTPEMLDAGAKAMTAIKRRSGYLAPSPRDVWMAMEAARLRTTEQHVQPTPQQEER